MNHFQSAIGTIAHAGASGAPRLLKPGSDTPAQLDRTSRLPSYLAGSNLGSENGRFASTPVPRAKAGPDQVVETELVGIFCAGAAVMHVLWPGQEVWLIRKRENPHDSNAIAVYRRVGKLIGYLSRGLAADLARYFDGYGLPVPARVTAVSNGCQPFIHVRFRVPRSDALDDAVPSDLMPTQKCKEMPPQGGADLCPPSEATYAPASPPEPQTLRPPLLAAHDVLPEPRDLQRPNADNHTPAPQDSTPLCTMQEEPPILPQPDGSIAETMTRAAAELRWVRIEYSDAWGKVTQRQVLPLARYVALDGSVGYHCFCALRQALRTFLCERVRSIVIGENLNEADSAYALLTQIMPEVRSRVTRSDLDELANYESAVCMGFAMV